MNTRFCALPRSLCGAGLLLLAACAKGEAPAPNCFATPAPVPTVTLSTKGSPTGLVSGPCAFRLISDAP